MHIVEVWKDWLDWPRPSYVVGLFNSEDESSQRLFYCYCAKDAVFSGYDYAKEHKLALHKSFTFEEPVQIIAASSWDTLSYLTKEQCLEQWYNIKGII